MTIFEGIAAVILENCPRGRLTGFSLPSIIHNTFPVKSISGPLELAGFTVTSDCIISEIENPPSGNGKR